MIKHRSVRTPRPRSRFLIAASISALLAATSAQAIWEVAEGELFLSANAGVSQDSNITGSSSGVSDTIFSLTPGVSFERNRGRASINLSASSVISRYVDYDQQNSEDYQASLGLEVPATSTGRLTGSFNASYFDGSRIDQYLGDRIGTKSFDLALNGEYELTAKINARLGTSYDKTEPENRSDFTNRRYTVGAGYNIRPAISTYLDVTFNNSSSGVGSGVGEGTRTSGTSYMIGLNGQITPKISGHVGAGFHETDTRTRGISSSDSAPTYDVALTWAPRLRTSLALSAASTFRATSIGDTAETVNVGLTLNQQIGQRMSASAGITHGSSDFSSATGRNDDVFGLNASLSYAIGDHANMGLSYGYTDSDSTNGISTFTRSVWSLTAGVRF